MMIEVEAIDEASRCGPGVDVAGDGHFRCVALELNIHFERKLMA